METIKNLYSERWYLLIGIFYLCLGIFILWRNIFYSISDYSVFWFSNIAPFILAFAFLARKNDIVKGVLNITFFPHILFLYGAFMMFFWEIDVFGVGLSLKYLSIGFIATSIFSHVSLIAAFFLNFKVRPTYKSLIYSLIFLIFMYFVAISYTPIEENVNYVFMFEKMDMNEILIMYIPTAFLLLVLPTFAFQVLMRKLWKYNHKKKRV